jgi:hypothetical protein
MAAIPIVLSEDLEEFVARKVAEQGLSSPSEYLAGLVEEQRLREAREQIEAELLKGLRSGASIVVTEGYWDRKQAEWLAEIDEQESA